MVFIVITWNFADIALFSFSLFQPDLQFFAHKVIILPCLFNSIRLHSGNWNQPEMGFNALFYRFSFVSMRLFYVVWKSSGKKTHIQQQDYNWSSPNHRLFHPGRYLWLCNRDLVFVYVWFDVFTLYIDIKVVRFKHWIPVKQFKSKIFRVKSIYSENGMKYKFNIISKLVDDRFEFVSYGTGRRKISRFYP